MAILIFSCAIAVLVSFMCSLAEAVLLSTDSLKMHKLKMEGKTFAIVWMRMKENIGRPIAAILILNTVAHTGGATIAAGAFHDLYGDRWLWLFSVVFTVVILLATEILPKVLGVSYNERLAPVIAKPLEFMTRILMPAIWLTEFISKKFRPPQEHKIITTPQIVTLVNLARTSKLIASEQENIIVNAIELHNNRVENVMIPKEDIAYLQIKSSASEIVGVIEKELHTRYPVSKTENLDDCTSYVNIKTILSQLRTASSIPWSKVAKPITKVSKDKTLLKLLKLFIKNKEHMALVSDGEKIVGLVTIEDVMQEILGNEEDSLTI